MYYSPHVDWRGVFCGAQQHVRGAIPQSYHFIGVGLSGDRFGPRQTCSKQGLRIYNMPATVEFLYLHTGIGMRFQVCTIFLW